MSALDCATQGSMEDSIMGKEFPTNLSEQGTCFLTMDRRTMSQGPCLRSL